MDQRLVKPVFWPILFLSSVALSVMTLFLIRAMISSRFEDYFIAFVVGFIMFVVARTVQNNVAESPKVGVFVMFFAIAVAAVLIFVMNNSLVNSDHVNFVGTRMHPSLEYMPRGLRWLGHYRQWARSLAATGIDIATHRDYVALHRAMYLSYGIIAGIAFLVLQAATCALLFIGTKPQKKELRH